MADQFVAVVAAALGVLSLAAATSPNTWPLSWSVARQIHKLGGPVALRLFFILGGILLIALGASLIS